MKKILSLILALFFVSSNSMVLAIEDTVEEVKAPVWEEYVPKKYQNPRTFPNRGKNIAELSVGIVLIDLLLTAPIGIPMTCHATTKMKNQGWYEKKIIFENGLKEAENIKDPVAKKAYYDKLLKKCKMTDKKHQKQLKKLEKQRKKEAKKLAKEEKKKK